MHAQQRCNIRTPRPSIVITQLGSRSNSANENRSAHQPTSAEVLKRTSSGAKFDQRDILAKSMTKSRASVCKVVLVLKEHIATKKTGR